MTNKQAEVDMHFHSHYSDGASSLIEIINQAISLCLRALILTDHDTVAGQAEFRRLCKLMRIECLTGVEVTSTHLREDVHILGLGVAVNTEIENELSFSVQSRSQRIQNTLDLLLAKKIIKSRMALEDIRKFVNCKGQVGSLWVADYLARFCNWEFKDARDLFVYGGECYVPMRPEDFFSPIEAINLVKKYGGLPVLAHPGEWLKRISKHEQNPQNVFIDFLETLVPAGLRGMEVFCHKHSEEETAWFLGLCRQYQIFSTAGSDSHGRFWVHPLGMPGVNFDQFMAIKAHLR